MPRFSVGWAALALTSIAPLHAQNPAAMSLGSVAGCYALTLGPWSPPTPSGSANRDPEPAVFWLDTSRAFVGGGMYRVRSNSELLASQGRNFPPAWRLRKPDSLIMSWSTGFTGVDYAFGVRGDSLIGTARAFTDVMSRPRPSASAVAIRVTCPPDLAKGRT